MITIRAGRHLVPSSAGVLHLDVDLPRELAERLVDVISAAVLSKDRVLAVTLLGESTLADIEYWPIDDYGQVVVEHGEIVHRVERVDVPHRPPM